MSQFFSEVKKKIPSKISSLVIMSKNPPPVHVDTHFPVTAVKSNATARASSKISNVLLSELSKICMHTHSTGTRQQNLKEQHYSDKEKWAFSYETGRK